MSSLLKLASVASIRWRPFEKATDSTCKRALCLRETAYLLVNYSPSQLE
jgi:hypothetical protein